MDSLDIISWLERLGQTRLIDHLNTLSDEFRERLHKQLETLDWQVLEQLLAPRTLPQTHAPIPPPHDTFEPVAPYVLPKAPVVELALGEAHIRAGKVALFTVCGGQGSRLGYEGPKGCFGVTPVRKHPLFGVFAEKLLAAQGRYGIEIPWVLMTSPQNNHQTRSFFKENQYFGLQESQVFFAVQGTLPAVDAKTGQLLLETPDSLSLAPDGTGGSFKTLSRSGALSWLKLRGASTLSYIQVDNPLVRPVDPLFLGAHLSAKSQYSSKSVAKVAPDEHVGVFARKNGRFTIVEYIELPRELTETRDGSGNLVYSAGNTAIHALELGFIESVAREAMLPYTRTLKKEPFWDMDSHARVTPASPNAYKFEHFIFDALPIAKNPMVFRVNRAEEFSPVKNATGVDSIETSRAGQLKQWANWLAAVGIAVPVDPTGVPTINFEITPLFADTLDALKERFLEGKVPVQVTEGLVLSI